MPCIHLTKISDFGNFLRRGDLPDGPFFFLVAAPGFLFLAGWFWSREHSGVKHA
jgi:hypothetical protein